MYSRQYLNSLYVNERRKAEDVIISKAILLIRDEVLRLAKEGKTAFVWEFTDHLSHRQFAEISKGLYTWFSDLTIVRKLNGFSIEWYC